MTKLENQELIHFEHIPVMLQEISEHFHLNTDDVYVDGTLGLAGHASYFANKIQPNGWIIGFDWDEKMLRKAKENLQQLSDIHTLFIHDSFSNIPETLTAFKQKHPHNPIKAILLDLGVNNMHFVDPSRGLSFMYDGPLDMRMDQRKELTAEWIINKWSEKDLYEILVKYGDERWHKRIVASIIQQRKIQPITSTLHLAEMIRDAVPAHVRRMKIHPATKTFQALRIAVNEELDELSQCIKEISQCLDPDGTLAVISYHSGEDRIIKHAFKDLTDKHTHTHISYEVLTKKPLTPTLEEIKLNPKSRSAKLRVIRKKTS